MKSKKWADDTRLSDLARAAAEKARGWTWKDIAAYIERGIEAQIRMEEQAVRSAERAVNFWDSLPEIYAEYAAAIGKEALDDLEKRQAVLNFWLREG